MKENRFERGQALVLIVLAVVAMFGFAALAVDIGRLYAERRRVQSAADAAALAAAFAGSQSQPYADAAKQQLQLNDVFDDDMGPNDGQRPDAQVYNPPISGPYGPDSGKSEAERNRYYQVIINTSVDQIFSQFVYRGPLALTVEAVARIQSSSGLFAGDVLHATSKHNCEALIFEGTADTTITGGDAYTDSDAGLGDGACQPDIKTKANCYSGIQSGSGTVTIEDGTIYSSGPWDTNGSKGELVTLGGAPVQQCVEPKDQPYIGIPDCTNLPNQAFVQKGGTNDYTLNPGNYADGIVVTGAHVNLTLNPGLYCLNGPLSVNGGSVTGDGVMFYVQKGNVHLGGSALVNLTMPGYNNNVTPPVDTTITDGAGVKWSGLLIYMPYENDNEVYIGGGSNSKYSGTIYAPGPRPHDNQAKCILTGNSGSISLQSNLICDTIKITGGANINLNYQENSSFHTPAIIDLAQ